MWDPDPQTADTVLLQTRRFQQLARPNRYAPHMPHIVCDGGDAGVPTTLSIWQGPWTIAHRERGLADMLHHQSLAELFNM